jgi:hypothetical protein
LGEPLSRVFYVSREIVDETALDGSKAISRVEGYCDRSHGVSEMMGSVVRGAVDKCRSCPYVKILRDLEIRDVRQGSCVGNGSVMQRFEVR